MSLIKISWQNSQENSDSGERVFLLPVRIGRGIENDLLLPVLAAGVSRRHAIIEEGNSGLIIRDLHSSNGTFVDSKAVSEKVLGDRAIIVIGAYRLQIERQVRCQSSSCRQVVAHDEDICPWCGRFLSDARTTELGMLLNKRNLEETKL